jgi:hypothetical protein
MTERSVVAQNSERLRRLSATGHDDLARTIIFSLLVAEEDKMAKLEGARGTEADGSRRPLELRVVP